MLTAAWSQAQGLTLKEAVDLAKVHNVNFTNKKIDVSISEHEKQQLIAAVLPTIEASSTTLFRDSSSVQNSFTENQQHTALLKLEQPLFKGGAGYYGLQIAKALPKIAELELRQNEQDLSISVSESFFAVLRQERDITYTAEQLSLLRERIADIRKRIQIGRSKKTDLLSLESSLSRVQSQFNASQSELLDTQRQLRSLLGPQSVLTLKEPATAYQELPNNWEQLLSETPQIKAQELLLSRLHYEQKSARSEYLPEVNLTGNYYLDRAGVLADSKWDVSLEASWQIFSGGASRADNQIKSLEVQKQTNILAETKRSLFDWYATKIRVLTKRQEELRGLEDALRLANDNYLEHRKELNAGLVSSLDVLRALEDLLEVKKALNQKNYEIQNLSAQLRIRLGLAL